MKTNSLTLRCKRTLYSIIDESLEEEQREVFNQIKDEEQYLNQICEDVVHYVTYELPLRPIILERIRGDKNVRFHG